MATSSYGASTKSSGIVRILKDLEDSVQGQHILVVEDIVDSGLTLDYLLRSLEARGPASVKVCGLLLKDRAREHAVPIDYVGITIRTDSWSGTASTSQSGIATCHTSACCVRAVSRTSDPAPERSNIRYQGMLQGFAIIVVQPPSDRGSPWWRGRQERSEA